jgi:hypothetical protein
VSQPPSHASSAHIEVGTEQALVQSKGGESAPGEHVPWPSSASQSSDSTTPLGHITARPWSHVADASGVHEIAASLFGRHAIHRAGSAVGNPRQAEAPLSAHSMPRSTGGPPLASGTHQCSLVPPVQLDASSHESPVGSLTQAPLEPGAHD